jgi:predicted MPP superfamily phosphohydrolase
LRKIEFIVFFGTFFTVYGLTNFYIFVRGWQALQGLDNLKPWYIGIFLVVSLSFIAGRVLERFWLSYLSDALVWIGSFWLAAMLYFFLIVILLDLVRIVNHFIPFFSSISADYIKIKHFMAAGAIGVVFITIIGGHINASIPRVKTLNLEIRKNSKLDLLKIAMASDIHLGTIIGRKRFCRIVDKINNLNPDIVLLPGDIVDEDLGSVIKDNLGEALKSIRSKYGTYAITGNHEYIGGAEPACSYLSDHTVHMLRDSSFLVDSSFYIVGREDRSSRQFAGKKRKSLSELVSDINFSLPVILMDHQPFQLEEAMQNKIDLQLSGHTHHGQLWPFNYITNAIYELSWGYLKKGNTHYYVSSGAGTWGPPVRTGNHPEVICINLRFIKG